MQKQQPAALLLRLSIAATYVSAYFSRLNLFGNHPDGWQKFLVYASTVNSYAPETYHRFLAISATILEITFSILLAVGLKTLKTATFFGIIGLLFNINQLPGEIW